MSTHRHQEYPISDLYGWIKNKELTLAPEFQRGATWTASALSFFIDTLLRNLPIPPIYIRLVTDTGTKTSYREVVDGQQRLSAIVKFIDGQLVLDRRSKEFAGYTYDSLDEEDQKAFLAYQVGVEQLFGADDDTVLDIFHRINAYGLSLNKTGTSPWKIPRGSDLRASFDGQLQGLLERWEILWSKVSRGHST